MAVAAIVVVAVLIAKAAHDSRESRKVKERAARGEVLYNYDEANDLPPAYSSDAVKHPSDSKHSGTKRFHRWTRRGRHGNDAVTMAF